MKTLLKLLLLLSFGFSFFSCAIMESEENLSKPRNTRKSAATKGGMEQVDSLAYVYSYQSNLMNFLHKTIHRNKDGVVEMGLSKADAKSVGISEELYDSANKAIEERNKR
jgi:hypothetical protein